MTSIRARTSSTSASGGCERASDPTRRSRRSATPATGRRPEMPRFARGYRRRRTILERQQRAMHDISHELRTPVTIARGHLELLLRGAGTRRDVEIALDELRRVDDALGRLLLLAAAQEADFLVKS